VAPPAAFTTGPLSNQVFPFYDQVWKASTQKFKDQFCPSEGGLQWADGKLVEPG
jgi:hypothetical protein